MLDMPIDILRDRLSPKRFFHTLGALESAVALALIHDAPPERAALAALLHDCARRYKKPKQWRLIEEWGVEVPHDAADYPSLWHAWLAPAVARREYGLDDPEIEEALRRHSTGAPEMTPIGEIVFIADCIEPMRHYAGVESIREAARKNLRRGVRACLEMTRDHLIDTDKPFHPDGQATLRSYSTQ